MKVRTLFIGSNWEALSTFKVLVEDERYDVIGLITQPDKPVGRKKVITPTEIKVYAQENDIDVFHTEGNEEKYKEALEKFQPELIICKSFGEMIPGFFLDAPKYKSINIHYSLLPKYRGAVPIQMAVLNGETTTGITIVKMVEKMDAGGVLEWYEEVVQEKDTNQSLRERLVAKTGEVLPDLLEKWIAGEVELKPQNDDDASYCWKKDISKDNAEVKWDEMDAKYIERMVRAFIPWPVVWAEYEGKRVKLFDVDVEFGKFGLKPGEFLVSDEGVFIGSKDEDRVIKVNELQIEGKKRVGWKVFISGHKTRTHLK